MRRWSGEEVEVLKEHYGVSPMRTVCELLISRTEASINSKASKLGLSVKDAGENLTVTDFCLATEISRSTVEYWIKECGFPTKKAKSTNEKYRKIKPVNFWIWAEENKHRIQWNDFPKYCLGKEPKWVDEIRKASTGKITKRRAWSSWEISELEYLLNQERYTYPELSKKLNRTQGAIKRKIYDLELPWPMYLPKNSKKYTEEEIKVSVEMYESGYPLAKIAEKMNRSEMGLRSKLERSGYQISSKKIMAKEGYSNGKSILRKRSI